MTRTEAQRIARHLHSAVFVTAANHTGKTWGYRVATGPSRCTVIDAGAYRTAQQRRAESISEMMDLLLADQQPDWMSEAFAW